MQLILLCDLCKLCVKDSPDITWENVKETGAGCEKGWLSKSLYFPIIAILWSHCIDFYFHIPLFICCFSKKNVICLQIVLQDSSFLKVGFARLPSVSSNVYFWTIYNSKVNDVQKLTKQDKKFQNKRKTRIIRHIQILIRFLYLYLTKDLKTIA